MPARSWRMLHPFRDNFGSENTGFETVMIANEKYREAMFDETGLLYTKLAISRFKTDPVKSRKYAKESLQYIDEKLEREQKELKEALEKLRTIVESIKKNQKIINIDEGMSHLKLLRKTYETSMGHAKAQYQKTLRQS